MYIQIMANGLNLLNIFKKFLEKLGNPLNSVKDLTLRTTELEK